MVLFLLGPLGFVWAQDEPEPGSRPEVVKERLRREFKERTQPTPAPEPVIEPPQEPKIPSIAEEGRRFLVQEIELTGNTVIPTEELLPLLSPYRGKEVGVKELQEAAGRIQQEYRSRGYVTTVAFLPQQKIEQGRVRIDLVEGCLGEVLIEGNRHFSERQILRRWKIPKGRILRYQELRRSLGEIQDNPDRRVQILLRPGQAPGTTDLVLKVTDHLPLHSSVWTDRQGTKSIGLYRFGWTVSHSSLLGRDDAIAIGMVGGENFGAGFGQYAWPLGGSGAKLTLSASHAQVLPERQFKSLGVNGTSETYSAALGRPFLLGERSRVDLTGTFDVSENRTRSVNGISRRERLRALRFLAETRLEDSGGLWGLKPEISLGIKGLGATSENNPVASRSGADPDFVKIELNLTRSQRMPWGAQANVSLTGQVSPSKLVPQEELSLGGANSVRGYPEGDYLADQGVLARLEYLIPVLKTFPDGSIQGIWFLDSGYGRLRAITQGEESSRALMGAGIGLAIQARHGIWARVELGRRLGDRPLTDDSDWALHLRLQKDF